MAGTAGATNIEWFDKQRHHRSEHPSLTIQKTGNGTINSRAAEVLGWPEKIDLGYDPEARVIALRAAAQDSPSAIGVRQQRNSQTLEFRLRSFLSFFGIEHDGSRRYQAQPSEDGEMLLVDLKEGGVDVSVKRHETSRGEE